MDRAVHETQPRRASFDDAEATTEQRQASLPSRCVERETERYQSHHRTEHGAEPVETSWSHHPWAETQAGGKACEKEMMKSQAQVRWTPGNQPLQLKRIPSPSSSRSFQTSLISVARDQPRPGASWVSYRVWFLAMLHKTLTGSSTRQRKRKHYCRNREREMHRSRSVEKGRGQ